jgi:pimeloyl-[acyl-carrier protein] synthase
LPGLTGATLEISSIRSPGAGTALDKFMLHRDGPDHLRLRRLVAGYFTTRAVDGLREQVTTVVQNLLAPLQRQTEFDFVAGLAEPLPLRVIAALVGIPEEDIPRIRQWSLALGDGFDSLLSHPEVRQRQKQAVAEFLAYVETRVEASKARPDQSLLGFLVQACGESLDHEELAGMLVFLLFAGNETTISLLGNTMWLLLSHPEQWAQLRQHPGLIPGAVEEALRCESPQQRTSFRLAQDAVVINGHRLEAGQQFGAIIGSANRDPLVFERADAFDISRSPNRHLAFGTGVHNCLGKTLARMEAHVALEVLLQSMPDLVLQEARPHWRRNSFFRGQEKLWLARQGGAAC